VQHPVPVHTPRDASHSKGDITTAAVLRRPQRLLATWRSLVGSHTN